MKKIHRYDIGDKVIYEGLIATIESRGEYFGGGLSYDLVADANSELTCTAPEEKCDPYLGQEIDEEIALQHARMSSDHIRGMVGNITDKYFRDGNH